MAGRANALIRDLALEPHPEGGYFREIFRSSLRVDPRDGRGERAALTTIYFLLVAGAHSRWHRVSSDEAWHFYEGDPLDLFMGSPNLDTMRAVRLARPGDGDGPSATVPAGWWQAARPVGAYALAGCTVAPGFEFRDFSFLRDNQDVADRLLSVRPDWNGLL